MQWDWQKQMDDKQLEIAKLQDRMAYLEHRSATGRYRSRKAVK